MENHLIFKLKKICFDIDGVICTNTFGEYIKAKPIKKSIEKINKLYDNGNYIILFTARFMGKNHESVDKAYKEGFEFTKKQMTKVSNQLLQLVVLD